MLDERECLHCFGLVRIRNPSGFCDHLFYPEYCDVCSYNREHGYPITRLRKEKEKAR